MKRYYGNRPARHFSGRQGVERRLCMADDLVALIYELKQKEAIEMAERRLQSGENPLKILDDGKKAMQIVGRRFSEGTYFIPDLVFSGKILEQIAELVKPGLA
jgi:5-methyltetrahydrofolate--homocysteine methyltransferase